MFESAKFNIVHGMSHLYQDKRLEMEIRSTVFSKRVEWMLKTDQWEGSFL